MTLAKGEVKGALHTGANGTGGAPDLRDLETRLGLRGRIEKGESAGATATLPGSTDVPSHSSDRDPPRR